MAYIGKLYLIGYFTVKTVVVLLLFHCKMGAYEIQICVLMALVFIESIVFTSNSVMAEDWDGILCYAGFEAKPKVCKSCVTVFNDCNSILLLIIRVFATPFHTIAVILMQIIHTQNRFNSQEGLL